MGYRVKKDTGLKFAGVYMVVTIFKTTGAQKNNLSTPVKKKATI
jgi:hypothetical protein